MSAVRDYYRDHRIRGDDLHKLLDREPKLLAQLSPLRARALSCCGPVAGKGGELKLAVVDPDSWDEVMKEQAALQKKLDAIDEMVTTLDGIFGEMEKAGFELPKKTIRGIRAVEQSKRTPVIDPHTRKTIDRLGHKIPQKQNPQLVAWLVRANAALQEAQAIVDEQRQTSPVHSPLTELAEKAKSLFV